MSPSAIVCCFMFVACLMAGGAAGEWKVGAAVGAACVALFLWICGGEPK